MDTHSLGFAEVATEILRDASAKYALILAAEDFIRRARIAEQDKDTTASAHWLAASNVLRERAEKITVRSLEDLQILCSAPPEVH